MGTVALKNARNTCKTNRQRPPLPSVIFDAAAMADNIYSKGTRVWFADKEQGWISAEVAQVTKSDGDAVKIVFVDERGKVGDAQPLVVMDEHSAIFAISGNLFRHYRKGHQGWEGRPASPTESTLTRNSRRLSYPFTS